MWEQNLARSLLQRERAARLLIGPNPHRMRASGNITSESITLVGMGQSFSPTAVSPIEPWLLA
jgi:hypothetical protein